MWETPKLATQPADPSARSGAVEALLALIAERRSVYHELGEIDADTIAAMQAAGVYRALVPARFGGDEASPADFLRL
ncbi:MAG TPA: hypothetical protein VHQ39_04280, partial [Dongiaceae bacterium]|nr:hypothetical protein [Dongiaceae bacterium]